jgi:predicted short-subunit dehydrogenase-like oxidoreductase (DUF2520 family)
MQIVLIGAGKLATNLAHALRLAGHRLICVYSRTLESAQQLADKLDCPAVSDVSLLPAEADLFVFAVKDDALAMLVPQVVKGREEQLFVHTAGSMPMSVFQDSAHHYGVFYPMQTFSKERLVDFREIPVFIEGSDTATVDTLRLLAESISSRVCQLSTDERRYLHLAAVFACNFANHCYALSAALLERHGLSFDIMLPLIDETARKVHTLHPFDAQTGPAVRYDEQVIGSQMQLLADNPLVRDIYALLSRSIHEIHQSK